MYLRSTALNVLAALAEVSWAGQESTGGHTLDLRQALPSSLTCRCPPPSSTLFVIPVTTTVQISVIGSGTLTLTGSPSTTTQVATTTVTDFETASTVTTCIAVIGKRQLSDTSTSEDGVSSTSTTTITETATLFISSVQSLPPPTTVTASSVSTVTVTSTSTPTSVSCAYVTIVTISGTEASTRTTTVVTATDVNPGTIELIVPTDYVTITSAQVGATVQSTTLTSTLATQSGLAQGTVLVVKPNYVVTTYTSFTRGGTYTIAQPAGTQQGTIIEIVPTPDLNCGNRGIQYAIMSNPYTRGLQRDDPTYSAFQAEAFQTATPQMTGVTYSIEIPFIRRDTQGSIYDNPPQLVALTAVNHRAYLFAKLSGQYTFEFPRSDDISLLWIGPNAYGPQYTRGNADLEQLYENRAPDPERRLSTYTVTLAQGEYVPFRVLWANAEYDAELDFNIFAPDGELITSATAAGVFSPYIVQFSFDGVSAPAFVPFGSEGASTGGDDDNNGGGGED